MRHAPMRGSACIGLLAAGCLFVGLARSDKAQPLTPARADDLFRQSVLPLLKEKCFACHGDDPKKIRGGLDLRTRDGMLKGGESGKPALVPGETDRSPLHVAVTRRDDLKMPPKDNDKLSPEQVEVIRRWVAAGAPWPQGETKTTWEDVPDGVTVATSGGLSPEWTNRKYQPEDLWAYRSIKRPEVPDAGKDTHPIDAFLRAKLKAKGVERTAPPADRRTLLRRVTLGLTGLPPAPGELDSFVKDESKGAFAKVVDRLLNSPHYGERMAQNWLDVVRYADTAGFANDFERPHAWRYRDWVVRAFNADKPYDRFVKEQLAGDELDPDDPEMLLAVGFLRMGPWEHTGMSVAVVTRQQFLDDVTHSVGVSFLGQGLRCASCHDHKFDPVPTKDYYRLQAVFAPVQFAEREVPFLKGENVSGFPRSEAVVEVQLKAARDAVGAMQKKSDDAVAAELKKRGVAKLTDLPESERPKKLFFGLTDHERSVVRIEQKRVQHFERELLRYQPYAFTVYNGPPNAYFSPRTSNPVPARRNGKIQQVHILTGGALDTPAEAVTPGVLSAAAGSNDSVAPTAWNTIPDKEEGRRLALANWVASPNNPLTARVIVNRVWQWHFGQGLVRTPNNFGKMGRRPTHPELLDWLAVWFAEHGWSIKKLHKLILTSAAYQQSGQLPDRDELKQADPNNELLAYFPPRRLSAEEIRDAMLAVTGELNSEVGGPGVFPEINWEVALQPRHVMGSVGPAYQPSPRPEQRNRRTLYVFRQRTLADPLQEVFNRPGAETSCERRDATTVTPQAFALFNGEFGHDRALALAAALEKKADTLPERIERAFHLCYGRAATDAEVKTCADHVARMTEHHRRHEPRPVPLPTKVKRKMVEEMTGEEYEWEEVLHGMKDYVRDRKPWDVRPETRALADLCLVLFNSNEFLYVR